MAKLFKLDVKGFELGSFVLINNALTESRYGFYPTFISANHFVRILS